MKSKFYIKCRTGPIGELGPLVLRIEDDIRIISAAIAHSRGCPKGLNVDGWVIFDMQSDGEVDGIEIFCPYEMDLTSRRALPRPQETYWNCSWIQAQKRLQSLAWRSSCIGSIGF